MMELLLPTIMSKVVDEGILNSDMKIISIQGLKMLGVVIVAIIVSLFSILLSSVVSVKFGQEIRRRVFIKVQGFSSKEIDKFGVASLITRTTNDITQVQNVTLLILRMMILGPMMAIGGLIVSMYKDIKLATILLISIPILLIVVFLIGSRAIKIFSKIQKKLDKVNLISRENLTGIRVIRAFNAEKFQEKRFEEVNNKLTNTQLFNQRCFAILNPIMNIVMYGLTLGIYFIGAYLIEKASMTDKITLFSDMVVFSSYGMQVIMSFLMLAMIFMMIPRANISAKRINEVLLEKLSITDGKLDGSNSRESGTVEFRNVSFKYPDADEYLLKNISFKVNKGETIAFIGSTGSGKSTLINLVPRFYDATEGEVLVDGINVKDYKQSSLNNKLGYVPQKAFMFTATVSENVAYGENGKEEITKAKIKKAIDVAQGTEFVSNMENTYDSHIARGGTNVSGGQKQRLAIARAIARDPEIYIFDDSFSALDFKTDALLRKELKRYTKNATSMIVAQRIGTIINADKIVVLDKGECVGIGNHKELLKSCEVYKEIALSQLSKEELENA